MLQLIKYLLYGIISGLSGIFPVSELAHQEILLRLFGDETMPPVCNLLIHMALLICVAFCNRDLLNVYIQERNIRMRTKNRRGKRVSLSYSMDFRVVTTAVVPMIIVYLLGTLAVGNSASPLALSAYLIINGIFLMIPEHIRQGNKEAKHMSGFDSVYFGLLSGLSFIPGISRISMGTFAAASRGADKQKALVWVLLLSIPAFAWLCLADIVAMITVGFGCSFAEILYSFMGAVFAFAGGYGAITLLRFLAVNAGYAWFAYYSWGAAIFQFVLYLIH